LKQISRFIKYQDRIETNIKVYQTNIKIESNKYQDRIETNIKVYQDRIETNSLQLFAHPEKSEWFSIISVIIFVVNIVAEQKQAYLVTIFLFFTD